MEDLPDPGAGSMPTDQQSTFNPWLVVDVVGSPSLTRLIGALTIDACEDIPHLDLSAPDSEEIEAVSEFMNPDEGGCTIVYLEAQAVNHHQPPLKTGSHLVAFGIAALCTSSRKASPYWVPGPLDELYPFSKSAPERKLYPRPKVDHLVTSCSLKAKELECTRRMKTLKNMQPSEINGLAEDMRSIAWRHMELDRPHLEEIWWRRVVSSLLEIRVHRTCELLRACLYVVSSVRNQGRYREAAILHQELHYKITKLFRPDHDLAIISRHELANQQGSIGDHESQVAIYRELLQIFLLRLGTRGRDTLNFLFGLGYALACCNRYLEAEALLRVRVQLDFELCSHTSRDAFTVQNAFGAMNSLARSLNQQGRYTDGRSVGNCAAEFFKDIIRIKTPSCSVYFYEKARALRFEGYLCESEELLRAILCHAPDRKNKNTMLVMLELADTLTRSGREAEAITLKKQAFCMRLEMFGVEDRGSEWHCWELGFCYARLGRYEDAIAIFNETIEKVALETLTDYEYRDRFINQLEHWISKVEAMKKEAQNAGQ